MDGPTQKGSGKYPIRVVARLTGIPVDTLRAWERRYGAVEPRRDDRGRLYTDADLQKLRVLRQLVDRGHAIGRIARMPDEELSVLLDAGAAPEDRAQGLENVDASGVMEALERYDLPAVERHLGRLAALLTPREFVLEVALPVMRRVGEAWERGEATVGQEHLTSAALRNLVGSLVRLQSPRDGRPGIVFATPQGERHEFGLLAAAMLAAAGGLGVVFLGADLPASDILQTARRTAARAVVLAVTGAPSDADPASGVEAIARDLPRGVELLVGGMRAPALAERMRAAGATVLPDFGALEDALRRLGGRF